jgi:MerR family transcriptional regulator, light-induced transcriptional regulator
MIEGVPEEAGMSIGEAAQRLGVSASTLRSWERRYALAGPRRSTGSHRRYSAADLNQLAAMQQLIQRGVPTGQAAALTTDRPASPSPHDLAGLLATAADNLDAGHITSILTTALLRHGAAATWNDLLAPLLTSLGERSDEPGCIVAEHVVSDTAEAVLRGHASRTRIATRSGPPVLLLALPGERHTLPLAALAAALADRDTLAVIIADVPAADLAHALRTLDPRAALVWARTPVTASIPTLREVQAPGRAVYAAGPGWDTAAIPQGIAYLAAFDTALSALESSSGPGRSNV